MSLPKLGYLEWALLHYGNAQLADPRLEGALLDLGSSGVPSLSADSLGDPREWTQGFTDGAIVRRYHDALANHLGSPPATLVPTLGTTHAIWAVYAALLGPKDEVLVERPFYEPLVRVAEGFGATAVGFDRTRGALDVAAIESSVTDRTKLCVVTNLHNPTSVWLPDDTLVDLAARLHRKNVHLLVDEVYRDLIPRHLHPGRRRTVFDPVRSPNLLTIGSLTKVYGLGWARLGWALAPVKIAHNIFAAILHDQGSIQPATASFGMAAIRHFDPIQKLSLLAREYDGDRRQVVENFIAARPHLSWTSNEHGIFGFVQDSRGQDLRPTIERAITEASVIVAPGSFFGAPAGFRLRYGAMAQTTLESGLSQLAPFLD